MILFQIIQYAKQKQRKDNYMLPLIIEFGRQRQKFHFTQPNEIFR